MEIIEVNKDTRGFINIVRPFSNDDLLGLKEITIFKTKRGFARGGCIHNDSFEFLVVIRGKIEYCYRMNGADYIQNRTLQAGDCIIIPPKTAHYMISVEDSVIMEWGPDPSEKQEKHEEFRKIVDEYNSRTKYDKTV